MIPPDEEWHQDDLTIGQRVLVYSQLRSTNTLLMELAATGAPEGLAILADEQTAGRGQHGRTWLSAPREGVLLSFLLRPGTHLRSPALLTGWVGVAVCAVVEQLTGVAPRLKWPNDVLVQGKKICGILIEGGHWDDGFGVVTGIGLNVTGDEATFAGRGLPDATALAALCPAPPDSREVARLLLQQLDREYQFLRGSALASLEMRWRERFGLLGGGVVIEMNDGPPIRGILQNLSFDQLTLRQSTGSVEIPPERICHIKSDE